jgi:hypothetical protein
MSNLRSVSGAPPTVGEGTYHSCPPLHTLQSMYCVELASQTKTAGPSNLLRESVSSCVNGCAHGPSYRRRVPFPLHWRMIVPTDQTREIQTDPVH